MLTLGKGHANNAVGARTNTTPLGSGVVDQSIDRETSPAYATLRALCAAIIIIQSQALNLTSVEDMPYAEEAEVLETPVSSVMSYLSPGRERLTQEEGQKTDAGVR